jgi:hypothetical protein
MVPNSLHATQTPLLMFMNLKFDMKLCNKPSFGTPAMFHQSAGELNPKSQLGINLSYVITSEFHKVRAWIVRDNRVKERSYYTVIKAYPRDLNFPARNMSVPSHIPDYFVTVLPKPSITTKPSTTPKPLLAKPTSLPSNLGNPSPDSVGSHPNPVPKRTRLDDSITDAMLQHTSVSLRDDRAADPSEERDDRAASYSKDRDEPAVDHRQVDVVDVAADHSESIRDVDVVSTVATDNRDGYIHDIIDMS